MVSTLQLSMDEHAFLLTSWILPVVAWVSKAYYAPTPVIRRLTLVHHVTIGTNSWGITLPILWRPRLQGGLALPEPELFLMHQVAAPFVSQRLKVSRTVFLRGSCWGGYSVPVCNQLLGHYLCPAYCGACPRHQLREILSFVQFFHQPVQFISSHSQIP